MRKPEKRTRASTAANLQRTSSKKGNTMRPSNLALKTATKDQLIADLIANDANCEPAESFADLTLAEVRGMWILSITCEGDQTEARDVIRVCNREGIETTCCF